MQAAMGLLGGFSSGGSMPIGGSTGPNVSGSASGGISIGHQIGNLGETLRNYTEPATNGGTGYTPISRWVALDRAESGVPVLPVESAKGWMLYGALAVAVLVAAKLVRG